MKERDICVRCDMYDIGICDDGVNTCADIENLLLNCAKEKEIHINIQVWYTGEELQNYLVNGGHLDILYLDIELFKMTGIEIGSYIRNKLDNMGLQIIYISGKTSYALQLFKTQPLDFLVKPIRQEQINDTIETAVKIISRKRERFEFQQGKDYYYIPQGEIIYFESKGRKVYIVTLNKIYEFYGRLKEIIKDLSEDFIDIHQSYVINKEHVKLYTYEMVELDDGTILSISQKKRKQVRKKVLRDK